MGESLGGLGDINNDGYDDFAVGSHNYDNGAGTGADLGKVYVYHGSSTSPVLAFEISNTENVAKFGQTLISCGDMNQDGYDDFMIGAPLADAGGINRGQTFLYFGSETTPGSPTIFNGTQDNVNLGANLSNIGDFNGDSLNDIAMGLPNANGNGSAQGTFLVYFSPINDPLTPNAIITGNENNSGFGITD